MKRHKDAPLRKKPGPPKRGYAHAHILLPPELIEWAKHHPEGLSALVRRLLAQERQRLESSP